MKPRLVLILFFVLATLGMLAQQPKRVFVTLDVSGSMEGNKYVMANYTAQLISVFCDYDDLVSVYYLNEKHEMGKGDGYKRLHISFDNLPAKKKTYHEIADLQQMMDDYRPDPQYQDWLFIIGDGDWDWMKNSSEYAQVTTRFENFVKTYPIHVCYLQTGNDTTKDFPFTQFLHKLASPRIEIRRSDITAPSVLGNCVYFANRILGFSNSPIHIDPNGNQCASFTSDFPLRRFLLLCQSDNLTTNDVKLESVTCAQQSLTPASKGNPTTKPLVKKGQPYMDGAVWEVGQKRTIPANEPIRMCFNTPVNTDALVVYPYVDMVMDLQPWSLAKEPLPESQDNVFDACWKDKKVKLVLRLADSQGNKFSPELMKRITVQYIIDSQIFTPDFNDTDTTYCLTVPLADTTLSYHATLESAGYFDWITETQTVRKTNRCPVDPVAPVTLPEQVFDPVAFNDLMEGRLFGGTVDDPLFQQVCDAGDFNVQRMEGDEGVFPEHGSFTLDGHDLRFTYRPQSPWCECDYPDTMRFQVTLLSDNGIVIGDKSYEGFRIPVAIPVARRGWTVRCRNHLFLALGLLLFILYLVAMLRKKRFAKSARITPSYYNFDDELVEQNGSRLRKRGLFAWLRRWLSPRDERVSLFWDRPHTGAMKILAGESPKVVYLARESFNPETMAMSGYQSKKGKEAPYLRWGANGRIEIVKSNDEPDGRLVFSVVGKNDEAGYRVFVVLLLLAAIAAEGYVVYTLLASLL